MAILNKPTKTFYLKDIFQIKKASNVTDDLLEPGNINYCTRRKYNNGVLKQINADNLPIMTGNCIIIGGESASVFYENVKFVAGNNITCLYHKQLNVYNGLYLVTLLKQSSIKYNYSRAWNKTNIENTSIALPITPNNLIDWDYMTVFMQQILKDNLNHFFTSFSGLFS